jgi:hypothetical protein
MKILFNFDKELCTIDTKKNIAWKKIVHKHILGAMQPISKKVNPNDYAPFVILWKF